MFGDGFNDINLADADYFPSYSGESGQYAGHVGNDDFLNMLDDVAGDGDFSMVDQGQIPPPPPGYHDYNPYSMHPQHHVMGMQHHQAFHHPTSQHYHQPELSMSMDILNDTQLPLPATSSMMPPSNMGSGMKEEKMEDTTKEPEAPPKPRRGRPPKNKDAATVSVEIGPDGVAIKPKPRSRRQKLTPEEREARKQQRLIQRRLRKSAREKERRSMENDYFEELANLVGLPPDQRDKATVLEAVISAIRADNPTMSQEEMERNLQNLYKLFGAGNKNDDGGDDNDGEDSSDSEIKDDEMKGSSELDTPRSSSLASMPPPAVPIKHEPMGPPHKPAPVVNY